MAFEQIMYPISGCILSNRTYTIEYSDVKSGTVGAWDTGSDNFDADSLFKCSGDENALIKVLQELEHVEK
jgi:hypothetical protein